LLGEGGSGGVVVKELLGCTSARSRLGRGLVIAGLVKGRKKRKNAKKQWWPRKGLSCLFAVTERRRHFQLGKRGGTVR